ncbi:hypothetical protein ILYODFUR_011640 [Ilyodon furcidens]|uniref:Uncharacterized protein n=1 Tax=Ilyodon furcidens TaxID=33524 RepID=A0ABV0V5W3_9TELE
MADKPNSVTPFLLQESFQEITVGGGSPTLCLPEIQSPQTAQHTQTCVPCSSNSRFLPSKTPEVVVDGFTSKEDAGSQIKPSEMLVRDDDGPETEIQPVRQVVVVCEPPWTPH